MELRTEEHGPHIVVVTIDNQPRRNAMPRSMMAELAELWDRLERSSCRCIVLTGAGDRAFSAGADLSGDLFDAALSSLGWGGRILLIGFVAGVPSIPANRLLVKHRSALGSSLRYFRWHAPDKLRRSVDELRDWYAAGRLRPHVTHRLPLEESVAAIRLLTDRKAQGKVVVIPGRPGA